MTEKNYFPNRLSISYDIIVVSAPKHNVDGKHKVPHLFRLKEFRHHHSPRVCLQAGALTVRQVELAEKQMYHVLSALRLDTTQV